MKKIFALLSILFVPMSAFAQTSTGAIGILRVIQDIANIVIPILITIAVIWFIYGVIKYVIAKDEGVKEQGRNAMISSIIGLFVIVSVWGLVAVIGNTFGIGRDNAVAPDLVPNVSPNNP